MNKQPESEVRKRRHLSAEEKFQIFLEATLAKAEGNGSVGETMRVNGVKRIILNTNPFKACFPPFLMEEKLNLGLADLEASLRRIETLLEWEKLFEEQQQHRGPCTPRLRNQSGEELQIELAWFYKQSLEIDTILKESPAEVKKQWQPKVNHLWRRYHAILTATSLNFKNPV
jgi:hypothetical protein